MAEWLNDIFRSTEINNRHNKESIRKRYKLNADDETLKDYNNVYKPPLIRTRHIIPQFKPTKDSKGKWNQKWNLQNSKVMNMYFLTAFVRGLKEGWVTFENSKGGINPEADANCRCNVNTLKTLRGTFLLSMLMGARDLHGENIGMYLHSVVK